jgi:hypothetical protein
MVDLASYRMLEDVGDLRRCEFVRGKLNPTSDELLALLTATFPIPLSQSPAHLSNDPRIKALFSSVTMATKLHYLRFALPLVHIGGTCAKGDL